MVAGLNTGSIYFLTVPSDHTVALVARLINDQERISLCQLIHSSDLPDKNCTWERIAAIHSLEKKCKCEEFRFEHFG